MAVNLADFIPSLKREVMPPGDTTSFAGATTADWLGNLSDGFWEARIDGLLAGFSCDNSGLVTPTPPGTADISRDLIQLVVFYAGYRILRNALRELRTMFKAVAGPVSFEYQQSANLLVALLKDMVDRRNLILTRLSDLGSTPSYVIDAIVARDLSVIDGETFWVGYGTNLHIVDYGSLG